MTDTKKVAIVTGASRGIGAAVAIALAKEGYAVGCAARATRDQPRSTPGTLDDVVDRIHDLGGEALSVPTDLYDRAQIAAMVEQTVAAFGRLDVLVNNAAASFRGNWDQPLRHHDFTVRGVPAGDSASSDSRRGSHPECLVRVSIQEPARHGSVHVIRHCQDRARAYDSGSGRAVGF
jgi:NAD(P)-dependent dehydrogenase (short-subunit alcohol dehydrogenase family)